MTVGPVRKNRSQDPSKLFAADENALLRLLSPRRRAGDNPIQSQAFLRNLQDAE